MRLTLPRNPRVFLLPLIAVTLASLCGCDSRPRRVPVSGQVLIDGKPVTAGFIRVVPSDARPASGQIGSDGRFTLETFDDADGCVPGTHQVTVSAFEQEGGGSRWLAPRRYCQLATSDVTATIEGPTDSLVINLTWAGGDGLEEPEVPDHDMTGDADPANLE